MRAKRKRQGMPRASTMAKYAVPKLSAEQQAAKDREAMAALTRKRLVRPTTEQIIGINKTRA